MKWLTKILRNDEPEATTVARTPYMSEYNGLSDFLRNAPQQEKIDVFTEAAKRASEDQRRTLERARVLHSS